MKSMMKQKYCALDTLAGASIGLLQVKKDDQPVVKKNKPQLTVDTALDILEDMPTPLVSSRTDASEMARTPSESSSSKSAPQQNKGRFSKAEKKILFGLIREDTGLFHAFLHQRKERMYGTKSWMHEIAQRYNKKATETRSLEAIRHHLMFRKTANGKGDKNGDNLLLEHAEQCHQCDTCTKCLIFQRSCVQAGWAKCGYDLCTECDKSLPHVSNMIQMGGNTLKSVPMMAGSPIIQQAKSRLFQTPTGLDTARLLNSPVLPPSPLHAMQFNVGGYTSPSMFNFLNSPLAISPSSSNMNMKFFVDQPEQPPQMPRHHHNEFQSTNDQQVAAAVAAANNAFAETLANEAKKRKWRTLDFEDQHAQQRNALKMPRSEQQTQLVNLF
eukprot:CAMPEP_0203763324 /NCGR_PEP_ID=MMETSP0098-20131031/16017_1 /ASSEMBLY_ACC=CAM_ASM_000208 /TAXON_ID=96639 /ORGANISM=" , Strain NY0313808BC1" /LENGTH=383 /DNA_ID=CAMNT_0050658037 /DNA_START=62 /DNA_END=1213 /DNA_ORIENTATION=-